MAHTHHSDRHGSGDDCRGATVRLSSHRTSQGTVVYERCSCGRPIVRLEPRR